MVIGSNGSSEKSLPVNMQDAEARALAYAFDRQTEKIMRFIKMLNVWSDLDNLDPKYYDYIATCLRTPYYDTTYSDRQKLSIIKSTFETYRFAGTAKAIKQLVKSVFADARFVPWYDYDITPGEAFHFKIVSAGIPSIEGKELLETMLKSIKAARSVIDGVEIVENPVVTDLYYANAIQFLPTILGKFIDEQED